MGEHRRRKGAVPYTANRIYGSIKRGRYRDLEIAVPCRYINCVYPQVERVFLDTGLEIGKNKASSEKVKGIQTVGRKKKIFALLKFRLISIFGHA